MKQEHQESSSSNKPNDGSVMNPLRENVGDVEETVENIEKKEYNFEKSPSKFLPPNRKMVKTKYDKMFEDEDKPMKFSFETFWEEWFVQTLYCLLGPISLPIARRICTQNGLLINGMALGGKYADGTKAIFGFFELFGWLFKNI